MNKGTVENPRHLLGISGGKDSSALAIHIKNTRPEIFEKLELFFTDTGSEIPETYTYLDKLESYLGKPILRLKATTDDHKYKVFDEHDVFNPFEAYLKKFKGYLPAPNARWCTREMKIKPMEAWVGTDHCYSYIGIRADEPSREGYVSKGKMNITPVYPYREDGLVINDVYRILENTVGLPEYYKWRTRSGCYFCFYQRRVEWAIMYELYPEWFYESKKYETEHEDGRTFTWVKDKPLEYVEKASKDIIKRYIKKQFKKTQDENQFIHTLDQMLLMVDNRLLKELIDSWDMKRLHDVDGENKDGCNVCAI